MNKKKKQLKSFAINGRPRRMGYLVHKIEYHKVTEEEKYLISEWKYDEPYSIYNNIPYAEQMKRNQGFADSTNNYYSFYDGTELIGYVNLKEKESNIFLGIGVNPKFCDRGY